ncbi:MAG: cytochrome c biogenesis protein CcsA, partial [Cellvibrionaceae bacterium]|nr:cytochrome c biogenesis protein CcsA [Cellvibrionaceae bacterium]
VLDTKFWLATHVITITLGYTATFLAGGIAVIWILGRLIGKLGQKADLDFSRAIYGLLCYALLLSFVGTVLGGLWADDSWGRFWGWDPKENGALMIVIWCAIVLHARLGGMISFRGLAATAVIGNIITCFSWFGVNLLGVGLHSYGFTDSGFKWVVIFSIVNLIFATLCMLPLPCWKRVSRKPLTEIVELRF